MTTFVSYRRRKLDYETIRFSAPLQELRAQLFTNQSSSFHLIEDENLFHLFSFCILRTFLLIHLLGIFRLVSRIDIKFKFYAGFLERSRLKKGCNATHGYEKRRNLPPPASKLGIPWRITQCRKSGVVFIFTDPDRRPLRNCTYLKSKKIICIR